MAGTFDVQKDKAVKTLGVMLDYLGLDAALRGEEKNERIAIKINSEEPGRIIGRNGQTLESMQYLLNLIMFSADKEFPRIMLDIDGYGRGNREGGRERGERSERGERPRRERGERAPRNNEGCDEAALNQQAIDAAKEVKRWGDPVTLPPMNAHDRRIIHVALKDDLEITTESDGEGAMKRVVIALKKD